MVEKEIFITKAGGQREAFDILKLEHSLQKSKASPETINTVVSRVMGELEDGMSTAEIYTRAYNILHSIQKPTALRYSLKRAIMDLGPSGFPFEKLIGEILSTHGYTVTTDKMLRGRCAEHEVDIVAHKERELILVEAKFHNSPGLSTDLKVVLYVKARMDDLRDAAFNYGEATRLTEGWLVTNTKFTTSAIKYAECQRLKIIGWNFPSGNSLQDMIEGAGFHPITCLTSLSSVLKGLLLEKGVVSCKSLQKNSDVLREAGLSSSDIINVQEEVKLLYI